jgi:hypothetical protein
LPFVYFKEVKSTGLKDLKALCKDIGIHIGCVGREELEVLLYIELGHTIPKCVDHMLDD